jgi:hypothetical protein
MFFSEKHKNSLFPTFNSGKKLEMVDFRARNRGAVGKCIGFLNLSLVYDESFEVDLTTFLVL